MTKKLYYSHSMRTYGRSKEQEELKQIREKFPKHKIVNPTDMDFTNLNGQEIMNKCFKIISKMDILVASEYSGCIGRGVTDEIQAAHETGVETLLLRDGKFFPTFVVVSVDHDDWAINYARCTVK